MKDILTVKEVAEYLRMNQMTIYKMAQKGEIPAFKIASNWRFRKEEIDEWLNQKACKVRKSILVVDDEPALCKLLQANLINDGFDVEVSMSGKEALEKIIQKDFDLVLLDLLLPEMDGVQTFKEIMKINSQIPVVMMTAYPNNGLVEKAIGEGVQFILRKPFDLSEVQRILQITLL